MPGKKLDIEKAATLIKQGGLVVFPAKCLYGLAVDASSSEAVSQIFKVKQRPPSNPILVLISDISWLGQLVAQVPQSAKAIMERFWPGDVTLVFEAGPNLPGALTAATGKIGVRLPQHPVARALVRAAGIPVTGTSANISGEKGCSRVDELDARLLQGVDMVLDAGTLKGGKGSTVVDVTQFPPRVLRHGEIGEDEILQCVSGIH
ncbi:translation factor SUA5 [Desulfocicer vacuolatum DSM 3385]|uniref:L-threonylcarbamoyladenylate synthase n=1 Tax=Desulfocicer vacuolatum DSM 3385 TaxID=1121400 RepID=A0A1W1ZRI7_9BACT|nr:L-threonylcarbamoyladenylate synthase [Desulfocicer vacuolatum]SMC50967.1 translation factor SUA5 [Desulfocicer vacuolatum DSM 3385]